MVPPEMSSLFPPPAGALTGLGYALAWATFCPWVLADWKDEVGYTRLVQEMGALTPKGDGLGVAQIEGPTGSTNNYAPYPGLSGQAVPGAFGLSGKVFTIKSADNVAESYHASDVARNICGTGSEGGRSGLAYGLTEMDNWEVNDWLDTGFLTPTIGAPRTETRVAQNHSWIYEHSAGLESTLTDYLRRVDFAVQRDGYLCVCGVNNVDTTEVPVLLATAYNVISVGRSVGGHSHGFTRLEYDGAGRIKPEIVAPLDFSSFSTAVVTGAGTVLRGAATTVNGRKPETIKAILLAGATKEEFPSWAKTTTRPLDMVYGAGELNIYNSYKILAGAEQPSGSASPVASQGWDYGSVTAGGNVDYLLEVPAGWVGGELSAVLTWHRQITDSAPGPAFNPSASVADLNLALYRLPGSPGTSVDSSASTVDNLEHVWKKNLCAGTYRLRVSGVNAASYGLAWRLSIVPPPVNLSSTITSGGSTLTLTFTGLDSGVSYHVESSTDLVNWTILHTFVATSSTEQWGTAFPSGNRQFYRLTWICP